MLFLRSRASIYVSYHNFFAQGYIETLVRHAYAEWNSLEEVAGVPSDSAPLLTQGIFSEFSY
jgi:hypothetical protein